MSENSQIFYKLLDLVKELQIQTDFLLAKDHLSVARSVAKATDQLLIAASGLHTVVMREAAAPKEATDNG